MGDAANQLQNLPEPLLEPPSGRAVSPPIDPVARLLPFAELEWADFERLCLRVAERVDGAVQCHLYGTPGQKQHGIDLFGIAADGSRFVYQVRRVQEVTEALVARAISDFAEGERPIAPNRFVLCVACSARSTQVQDAVEAGRRAYLDLFIDLYDQELLSEKLRSQPDVVEAFFGPVWRDRFCLSQDRQPSRSPAADTPKPNADMLLRGPIRALGLLQVEQSADANPDRLAAAGAYASIAKQLDDKEFRFHARTMRQRQADALAAAGVIEDAYELLLKQVVAEITSGAVWLDARAMRWLEEHRDQVSSSLATRYDATVGVERWFEDPTRARKAVLGGFEALADAGDAWAPTVAVWLGEMAVVDECETDPDILSSASRFADLPPNSDEFMATRLRVVRAEIDGEWDAVLRDADFGSLSPADAGLVFARRGRWLALHAEPEPAIGAYRRAVEKLAHGNLMGDASRALQDLAAIDERYIGNYAEILENLTLGQSIRDEPTRLGGRRDPRGEGLAALHNDNLPDAHRSFRRYLWQGRISGHLREELEARTLLGDLYRASGEADLALAHYVRAGAIKVAVELAKTVPPSDVSAYFDHPAPWMAATALGIFAACGDLVPEMLVARVAPELIRLTGGVRQGRSGPQVVKEAWSALASVALQLPDDAVERVLDLLEPLIEREPGRYRVMGKSLVGLLVAIHQAYPHTRERASLALARCLAVNELFQDLMSYLPRAIESDEQLKNAVIDKANGGERLAIETLSAAGMDHPAIAADAIRRVEAVLSYEVGIAPTSFSWPSGFEEAASFARVLRSTLRARLARKLIAIAQDRFAPERYRVEAVNGLSTLRESVTGDVQAEAFEAMLALAAGAEFDNPADTFSRNSLHPLSRFRWDFGLGILEQVAIRTAGRYAKTAEDAQSVLELIRPLLQSGEESHRAAGANAILAIDARIRPMLDAEQFANHPSTVLRVLAVELWAADAAASPNLGQQFAGDPDMKIRRRLANKLPLIADQDRDLSRRLRVLLLNDPSAVVRTSARLVFSEQAET